MYKRSVEKNFDDVSLRESVNSLEEAKNILIFFIMSGLSYCF